MRTQISLAIGLTLTAIAVGVVLSRSPLVLARTNSVPIEGVIGWMPGGGEACQKNELLPQRTTAMRLSIKALLGPRVSVRVMRGRELLTSGEHGSGWSWQSVTVPVRSVRMAAAHVTVCLTVGPTHELMDLEGGPSAGSPLTVPGSTAGGSAGIRIEYLRPGSRSWWSLARAVAGRMGLGRVPSGTWTVVLVIAAMAALAVVTSWIAIRQEP
jgi:uncharacterized protein YfiM (DUF2279 family)